MNIADVLTFTAFIVFGAAVITVVVALGGFAFGAFTLVVAAKIIAAAAAGYILALFLFLASMAAHV